MSFDRLQDAIKRLKNPIAARLCGFPGFVPPACAESADALANFHAGLLDALCGITPAVLIDPAGYERLGGAGMCALSRTLALARGKGFYTIADRRHSATGDEATALAAAWLGDGGVFESDCVTVNPYLGSESIIPFIQAAKAGDRGVFLIARTASAVLGELQDMIAGDRMVYSVVGDLADRFGKDDAGQYGYQMPGIAADAGCSAEVRELRRRVERVFFLIPGYGLPYAGADEARHAFDHFGRGAVLADGGLIEAAWSRTDGGDERDAARAAAIALRDELKNVITIL